MSHTVVKEKAKKTKVVVLAYIEEGSSPKRVKSSVWTKIDTSKMDTFDRKAAQMEAALDKFPRPSVMVSRLT